MQVSLIEGHTSKSATQFSCKIQAPMQNSQGYYNQILAKFCSE